MKRRWILIIATIIFVGGVLRSTEHLAFGSQDRKSDCDESSIDQSRWSESRDIVSVHGKVVRIDRMEQLHGVRRGMHLTLTMGQQVVRVHLGPSRLIEENGIKVKEKDVIDVRGFYIDVCGNQELFAVEIKKGNKTFKFHDGDERPSKGK